MAPEPPVHGGVTPPNPQLTQQFLSSVLSQRGPSSLPYSEDVKWLIRQQLIALLDAFPSLQPKTATYTHNDGRSVNLLQADGTIPMVFQDVTYNIPVIIWLIETYPRHPPCVYVNPTRDMIIKRPHPFVNPSGMVSIPYLHNWVYPSSNLVDLARNLSHLFARDPPLYSQRRPTNPPTPNPNPNPNPYPRPTVQSPSVYPPYGSGSSGGSRTPPPPVQRAEDAGEVFRRNAINKLVIMAHGDINGLSKSREPEMEGLFNAQGVLRQRQEHLRKGIEEMYNEKEGLEQQLQMVLMNSDVLEGWLRENATKVQKSGSVEIDDVFEPCDVLSKQMIESTSSDLAIEDTIYSLDKAVQEGAIPFDQYLRSVRMLSREQYFHRAMSAKIRAAQMQSQVANMSARISNYVAS